MKVLIIGGVAAGMSAASKIKRANPNFEVIVVEKGNETSYGACGLPYYVSGVNNDEDLLRIRKAPVFISQGIDLRLENEAISADLKNKTVEIRNIKTGEVYVENYDKLVIATGASAVVPPFKGINLNNVFTLKTIEDANKIRNSISSDIKNIVIVGAGYIGMELVESFLHLNKNVRVIEMAENILTSFDKEISSMVLDDCINKGVNFNLGEAVQSLEGESNVSKVVTNKGEYDADMVILSIGVRPNTQFLRDTGIEMLPNGAVVADEYMRTSVEDVYAGGDCATVVHKLLNKNVFIPLGTNANKQGRLIGENILGGNVAFNRALGSAMIRVNELELARTGLSEQEAIREGINYGVTTVTSADHAPYYPNPQPITVKLVYENDSKILLGAQLIGKNGVALRMNVFAACIDQQMTAGEVGLLDLGYAPPFAMPWDVIHVACNAVK